MRYFSLISALCLFCISCNKETLTNDPIAYSMMPGYLDVNTIMPPMKIDTIGKGLPAFKAFPIDSGEKSRKNGIVICEDSAMTYIARGSYIKYLTTRMGIEDTLMRAYYNGAVSAEKVYQTQIQLLKRDVKRTWLEKNIVYFGFIAGLSTAILTEYAVGRALK